jgi:hypothetical protein
MKMILIRTSNLLDLNEHVQLRFEYQLWRVRRDMQLFGQIRYMARELKKQMETPPLQNLKFEGEWGQLFMSTLVDRNYWKQMASSFEKENLRLQAKLAQLEMSTHGRLLSWTTPPEIYISGTQWTTVSLDPTVGPHWPTLSPV